MAVDSPAAPLSPAGDEGAAAAFRVFSDRSASDLEAFEWNPSMDLLACLTSPPDSTMSIYRLLAEDQTPKLLSEKIPGVGSALTWSPCGRRVAVGDRLGGVAIYDGETGALLHSRRLHARPVVALSWAGGAELGAVAGAGSSAMAMQQSSRMLPPLLALPNGPSNIYSETPEAVLDHDAATGGAAASFSLLVSADEGGLVVVSVNGTFPVQATRLFHDGEPAAAAAVPPPGGVGGALGGVLSAASPGGHFRGTPLSPAGGERPALAPRRPRSCELSPDFRYMAVLLGLPGQPSASAAPSGRGSPRSPLVCERKLGAGSASIGDTAVGEESFTAATPPPLQGGAPDHEVVLVIDVRRLCVRRAELSQFSRLAGRFLAIINYTRQAVEAIGNSWGSAVEAFASKMQGLSELVDAFRTRLTTTAGAVHEDLLLACCTGRPSDALHSFLTRQTSSQQLSRLERGLQQALDHVGLVVCTRLQVAVSHMLTILQELLACADWARKFRSIGLHVEPLRQLVTRAEEFNRLTERLVIECAEARRFARGLFHLLVRTSQRLSEAPSGTPEPGSGGLSSEDMGHFVHGLQQGRSLEFVEVTQIIGAARPSAAAGGASQSGFGVINPGRGLAAVEGVAGLAEGSPSTAAGPRTGRDEEGRASSLSSVLRRLAAEAEAMCDQVAMATSTHAALLACVPVRGPSPWNSLSASDIRAAAAGDAASGIPSPRGLGRPTLSIAWRGGEGGDGEGGGGGGGGGGGRPAVPTVGMSTPPAPACLLLVWSGSSQGAGAELHVSSVTIPPAPPAVPVQPQLELARLRVGDMFRGQGGMELPGHFVLCQVYQGLCIAALVIQEAAAGGLVARVCLVDTPRELFRPVADLLGAGGGRGPAPPPATTLSELPEGTVRSSAPLPACYAWTSALRVMAARGVCSVYAWRARRLLTLDMQGDEGDDEEDDGDEEE